MSVQTRNAAEVITEYTVGGRLSIVENPPCPLGWTVQQWHRLLRAVCTTAHTWLLDGWRVSVVAFRSEDYGNSPWRMVAVEVDVWPAKPGTLSEKVAMDTVMAKLREDTSGVKPRAVTVKSRPLLKHKGVTPSGDPGYMAVWSTAYGRETTVRVDMQGAASIHPPYHEGMCPPPTVAPPQDSLMDKLVTIEEGIGILSSWPGYGALKDVVIVCEEDSISDVVSCHVKHPRSNDVLGIWFVTKSELVHGSNPGKKPLKDVKTFCDEVIKLYRQVDAYAELDTTMAGLTFKMPPLLPTPPAGKTLEEIRSDIQSDFKVESTKLVPSCPKCDSGRLITKQDLEETRCADCRISSRLREYGRGISGIWLELFHGEETMASVRAYETVHFKPKYCKHCGHNYGCMCPREEEEHEPVDRSKPREPRIIL